MDYVLRFLAKIIITTGTVQTQRWTKKTLIGFLEIETCDEWQGLTLKHLF